LKEFAIAAIHIKQIAKLVILKLKNDKKLKTISGLKITG